MNLLLEKLFFLDMPIIRLMINWQKWKIRIKYRKKLRPRIKQRSYKKRLSTMAARIQRKLYEKHRIQ